MPSSGILRPIADHVKKRREDTRSALAIMLVVLVGVVSILLIVARALHWIGLEGVKDLALAILSPLVALTASSLGFYFGGHKDD